VNVFQENRSPMPSLLEAIVFNLEFYLLSHGIGFKIPNRNIRKKMVRYCKSNVKLILRGNFEDQIIFQFVNEF